MTTLGEVIQENVEKYGWCKTGLDGIALALLMRVGNVRGEVELDGKKLSDIPAYQQLPDGELDTVSIAVELFRKEGGNVMHGPFVLNKSLSDALGNRYACVSVDGVLLHNYPRSIRLEQENEEILTRILGQRCEVCEERTQDESGICPRCQEAVERQENYLVAVSDSYDYAY